MNFPALLQQPATQSLIQRFTRMAMIAPFDAHGASMVPHLLSLATAHLMEDAGEESREARMDAHFRQVLSAYGRGNVAQEGKAFPYAGNGTAIIPIHGILLNRYNWADRYATGYNAIRSMLNAAIADSDVSNIVLDINSPGGQAAGCFELGADIRAAREVKPVVAIVDAFCFSAAYALASSATKIIVTPTGEAGSIGVVATHTNIGPLMEKIGVDISFIFAGAHKVDGHPYGALTEDAKADIQAGVDKFYGMFVSSVAEGRGDRLSEQDIRDTEARCYDADAALSLGLIDAVMASDAALASIEAPAAGDPAPTGFNANSDTKEPNMTDIAAAQAQARADERARVAGILGHPEAKGRETLARHLAENTEMSVEDAGKTLAASPKAEVTSDNRSPLDKAMDRTEQPNVGTDDEANAPPDADPAKAASARILANYKAAGGSLDKRTTARRPGDRTH